MASIKKTFLDDHAILDTMIAEFLQAQKANTGSETHLFNDVKNALKAHMKKEEELYTSFQQKSSELNDVIKSVRTQHDNILRLITNIADEEDDVESDPQYRQQLVQELLNVVKQHEVFEEEYLYEKFDEIIDDGEKEQIIYDLQSRVKETR